MIEVRAARAGDVTAIRDVFQACYGPDYPYAQFCDLEALTRLVYSDHQLLLVAEDTAKHRILGKAFVLLVVGAYSDLMGEFGRLAVHPGARRAGVGRLLMNERLARVRDRLHVVGGLEGGQFGQQHHHALLLPAKESEDLVRHREKPFGSGNCAVSRSVGYRPGLTQTSSGD